MDQVNGGAVVAAIKLGLVVASAVNAAIIAYLNAKDKEREKKEAEAAKQHSK